MSSVGLFILLLVGIGFLMMLFLVDFVTACVIGFCMLMGALELFGKVDCYFHPENKYCQTSSESAPPLNDLPQNVQGTKEQ